MRPISIMMSAFGPFAGVEEVDFTQLGKNPLFLINGPTGSGKTTILDAICFALYGETTGTDRDGKEMRCDHAAVDEETAVEFIFELGESRYRIRRIPEQERPKIVGEGITNQPAEAQLYKVEKDGEEQLLVPRKIGDANKAIVEITGLSSEQFRQIMVLPQGKFRDFLLASSADREKIFTTLFQTEIYSRLEARLRDSAIEIYKKVQALKNKCEGMLTPFELESHEELLEKIEKSAEKMKKAGAKKDKAEKALQKAQRATVTAQDLEGKFTAHAVAEATLKTLLERADEFKELAEKLERAKKSRELQPTHDKQVEQQQTHRDALETHATCNEALTAADEEVKLANSQWDESQKDQPKLEDIKKELVILEGHRGRVTRLTKVRENLQDDKRLRVEAKKGADQAQLSLAAATTKKEKLESEREEIEQNAIAYPTKKAEHGKVVDLVRLHAGLDANRAKHERLTNEQKEQSKSLQDAAQELQVATDNRKAIEKAWGEGQAAIMARTLNEGEPCPVCGSTEHPVPALSGEELPAEQDLEFARSEEERVRDKRDGLIKVVCDTTTQLGLIVQRTDKATEKLGEHANTPHEELQIQLSALAGKLQILQHSEQQLQEHKDATEAAKEAEGRADGARQAADAALQGLVTTEATVQQSVTGIESELPEQYRATGALEAEITSQQSEAQELTASIEAARKKRDEAIKEQISAKTRLDGTQGTLGKAVKIKEAAEKAWDKTLLISEFEDEQDFSAAVMDPEKAATLNDELRVFQDEKLVAEKDVNSKAKAIEGKQRPDIAEVQLVETEARKKSDAAIGKFHKREGKLEQLNTVLEELKKSQDEQEELEEQYKVVGTLSDVANGKNQYRTSLQRFVLGVLLDDVLVEAGQKLRNMSRGRYQLRRRSELADRRSQAGLDLVVDDAYTGKERGVSTLSGGESFMAALALALGLSAVVQAYAGGIRLDTLFIDEGFGSLDTESLDLAINTLLELQSAGIMVGVISHVAELKERMDVRLDLTTSQAGSHVMVVTP